MSFLPKIQLIFSIICSLFEYGSSICKKQMVKRKEKKNVVVEDREHENIIQAIFVHVYIQNSNYSTEIQLEK